MASHIYFLQGLQNALSTKYRGFILEKLWVFLEKVSSDRKTEHAFKLHLEVRLNTRAFLTNLHTVSFHWTGL